MKLKWNTYFVSRFKTVAVSCLKLSFLLSRYVSQEISFYTLKHRNFFFFFQASIKSMVYLYGVFNNTAAY